MLHYYFFHTMICVYVALNFRGKNVDLLSEIFGKQTMRDFRAQIFVNTVVLLQQNFLYIVYILEFVIFFLIKKHFNCCNFNLIFHRFNCAPTVPILVAIFPAQLFILCYCIYFTVQQRDILLRTYNSYFDKSIERGIFFFVTSGMFAT